MNKFSDFFGKYLDISGFPDKVREGDILGIRIDSEKRIMELSVKLAELVDKETLFRIEKTICESILNLFQCHIYPKYDADLFRESYYPELAKEMKRRYASLNGTLNDSAARMAGEELVITLQHGGQDILLQQGFEKKLSELIKEEFGLHYRIVLEGVLTIDADSAAYIEQQKINEEKVLREQQIAEQEQYESMMQSAAAHKAQTQKKAVPQPVQSEIEIRQGAFLNPACIPDSAVTIYGSHIKGELFLGYDFFNGYS